jgi:hypothetical protein
MKLAKELSKRELVELVEQFQELFYLEPTGPVTNEWAPHREWNSETLEVIGNIMSAAGLRPETAAPAECAVCNNRVRPGVRFCAKCSGKAGV